MLVFGNLVLFWRNVPVLFCIHFHPPKFVGKDLPGESLTGTYGVRIDLSLRKFVRIDLPSKSYNRIDF